MSEFPVEVSDIQAGAKDGMWLGKALLPGKRYVGNVMIFKHGSEYVLISAYCPHNGYDLSRECLQGDRIICPLHGWEIAVFDSGANVDRYQVEKQGEHFTIIGVCP